MLYMQKSIPVVALIQKKTVYKATEKEYPTNSQDSQTGCALRVGGLEFSLSLVQH